MVTLIIDHFQHAQQMIRDYYCPETLTLNIMGNITLLDYAEQHNQFIPAEHIEHVMAIAMIIEKQSVTPTDQWFIAGNAFEFQCTPETGLDYVLFCSVVDPEQRVFRVTCAYCNKEDYHHKHFCLPWPLNKELHRIIAEKNQNPDSYQ